MGNKKSKESLPYQLRFLPSNESCPKKPYFYSNLSQLEAFARPLLTDAAYDYYSSGANGQFTLKDNLDSYARYRLLPRAFVDVSVIDTMTTLFKRTLSFPVLIAPMAMMKLCHEDGELAVARAVSTCGNTMIVSTMATSSVEEVASAMEEKESKPLWLQIYVLKRRDITESMIREAEVLGYEAIVVTVDAPRLGKREADERNVFALPHGLCLKNLEKIEEAASVVSLSEGADDVEGDASGNKFGRHFSHLIDPSVTEDIIPWIKSLTQLPVLVKGVLAPDDARKAVEIGVDGIIISNHGGRQLDGVPAALDMLPPIAAAVGGRTRILIDGGVRRGTDILKAIALGADAVLLGRPTLWALTLGGQEGVEEALQLLKDEFELAMALCGCTKVSDVGPEFLILPEPVNIHRARR